MVVIDINYFIPFLCNTININIYIYIYINAHIEGLKRKNEIWINTLLIEKID